MILILDIVVNNIVLYEPTHLFTTEKYNGNLKVYHVRRL